MVHRGKRGALSLARLIGACAILLVAACGDNGPAFLAPPRDVVELPSGVTIEYLRRGPDQSLPPVGDSLAFIVEEASVVALGIVSGPHFDERRPGMLLPVRPPGIAEVYQNVRLGDHVAAHIPADLAYGSEGRRAYGSFAAIPPNSDIRLELEIVGVVDRSNRLVLAAPTSPLNPWRIPGHGIPEAQFNLATRAELIDATDAWLIRGLIEYFALQGDRRAMLLAGFGHAAGSDYWGDPDHVRAAEWYLRAATAGDARAMFEYSDALYRGRGVARDLAQSTQWLIRSAEAGNALAMGAYGMALRDGDGVARNASLAMTWFVRAFEAGRTSAAADIGMAYVDGDGVSRNFANAAHWFRRGAEAGDAQSMANLAGLMRLGRPGVPRDSATAVYWARRAAEAGNWTGMYNLSSAYADGTGVPQSYATARQWLARALAAGGERDSIENGLREIDRMQYGYAADTREWMRQADMWSNQEFERDMRAAQRDSAR